jgi:hypothetical protein
VSTGGGNSFFESTLDIVAQAFTGGAIGFKSDEGGLGVGVTGEVGVDTFKEITGAAAAEEANADARKRFEEEKAASDKQRADNVAQSAANELQKSRSAASARGGVSGSSKGQSRFSSLGNDESDFLGL